MADKQKPSRRRRAGIVGKLQEAVEDRTGLTAIPTADLQLLETAWDELRSTNRMMDYLGWQVLDYIGGQPNELRRESRLKMVQRSRYVWINDPQAGASTSLMNDFVFGRGVPSPSAKDKAVAEVLEGFWSDPDNKRSITTFNRQLALGVDLALQANFWLNIFDDGEDGVVKVSLLDHDLVENYVRDPENPQRVLYWLVKPTEYEWDFQVDRQKIVPPTSLKPIYYEDFSGMKEAEQEQKDGFRDEPPPKAPTDRLGKGRLYHVAINRFSSQTFGNPEMQRLIRWYSAYNDFMKARVDMAQASAAFIMKRKVKGTPQQLARSASKALSSRGEISGGMDAGALDIAAPPMSGSILQENEGVSHENFKVDSGAGNAQQDAHMIRAPISAATRFPQSYYGDEANSSLATATSLELPVLKAVESRQEVFEQMYRDLIDLVIERAVDAGKISKERSSDEITDLVKSQVAADLAAAAAQQEELGHEVLGTSYQVVGNRHDGYTLRLSVAYEDGEELREAHEDKPVDESETKRDLSYEFSMPSPLRRMMTDLVTACQTTAATFDPNNTNTELTRVLATIVFGEAFEVQDPGDLVDRIWPKGYVDPMMAAAQAQAAPPEAQPRGTNPFGPDAQGDPFPSGGDSNPYGAPMNSRLPEQLRGKPPYNAQEAEEIEEADAEVAALFDRDVADVALAALNALE